MRICIIGGGIIGVSTAYYILKENPSHNVTVITELITPNTTADGAAGIWGPYLLEETPLEKQHYWAKATHDFIESLWSTPEAGSDLGIQLVSSTRLNCDLAPIWQDIVYGFRWMSRKELDRFGRIDGKKHERGAEFLTWTIEPVAFLPWLMKRVNCLGGKFITGRRVSSFDEQDLKGYDILINCTGLGARTLVGDKKVQPIRGQVMRIEAPWVKRVVLDDGWDDSNYVIPNRYSVVLGGTHQSDWNESPYQEDKRFIWEGCKKLFPSAITEKKSKFIKDWVGLRPGRPSVRLEREENKGSEIIGPANGQQREIIHNYGHGGSGITLFWGCAEDVYKIVNEIEAEKQFSKL